MTITFPILLSGICGSLLGSSIFDADEIKNEFQAMLRGLMVAALSYLLIFALPAIILAFFTPDFLGVIIYALFLFACGTKRNLILVG